VAKPEYITGTTTFLVSKDSGDITGWMLMRDGRMALA